MVETMCLESQSLFYVDLSVTMSTRTVITTSGATLHIRDRPTTLQNTCILLENGGWSDSRVYYSHGIIEVTMDLILRR
jgi:hypothetical protein